MSSDVLPLERGLPLNATTFICASPTGICPAILHQAFKSLKVKGLGKQNLAEQEKTGKCLTNTTCCSIRFYELKM